MYCHVQPIISNEATDSELWHQYNNNICKGGILNSMKSRQHNLTVRPNVKEMHEPDSRNWFIAL
jgi:hypothetical protein